MKILLIGAEGRLGQMLGKLFAREDLLPLGHTQLDICDEAAVRRCFEAERPDCVLNTAAFHGIDDCEAHPDRGFAVNAAGAAHVARAAQSAGAVVAHFSTDYVFDGAQRKPYTETDAPAPLSVYAISKLAGEWAVRRYCERHFVVRTSTLFGPPARRHFREDFVGKMLRLAREGGPIRVVCDQWRSPTRATDLATLVAALIPTARYGTYHISNSGGCTWEEFAREIFRQAGLAPEVLPVTAEALSLKARRPVYSVLEHAALRTAGIAPSLWQEALAEELRGRLGRSTRG